jgi:hypothetical protein
LVPARASDQPNPAPMAEIICAEDSGEDHFHHNLNPIPQADKADF